MKIIRNVLVISAIVLLFSQTACKDAYESELEDIDNFIAENFPDATKYDNGLYLYWEKIGEGDSVSLYDYVGVHYRGKFFDGDEFDSSYDNNDPFYFFVGQGQVIQAWDFGVQQMRVGDKVHLITPSSLAYGSYGRPPKIDGYTPLWFEIEVLNISSK